MSKMEKLPKKLLLLLRKINDWTCSVPPKKMSKCRTEIIYASLFVRYFPFKSIPRFYDIGGFMKHPDIFQKVIDAYVQKYKVRCIHFGAWCSPKRLHQHSHPHKPPLSLSLAMISIVELNFRMQKSTALVGLMLEALSLVRQLPWCVCVLLICAGVYTCVFTFVRKYMHFCGSKGRERKGERDSQQHPAHNTSTTLFTSAHTGFEEALFYAQKTRKDAKHCVI